MPNIAAFFRRNELIISSRLLLAHDNNYTHTCPRPPSDLLHLLPHPCGMYLIAKGFALALQGQVSPADNANLTNVAGAILLLVSCPAAVQLYYNGMALVHLQLHACCCLPLGCWSASPTIPFHLYQTVHDS